MNTECSKCGLVGQQDMCEEAICPGTTKVDNGQELDFNKDDGSSLYLPEYIPVYSDPEH